MMDTDATEQGLLRWRDVTRGLRVLALRGDFGANLKLIQQADGTWELVETVPVQVAAAVPVIRGRQLVAPTVFFEGEPITVGGIPCNDDPPPELTLTDEQLEGWSVGYIEVELDELGNYETPSDLIVGGFPLVTPGAGTIRVPLFLIRLGEAMGINIIY